VAAVIELLSRKANTEVKYHDGDTLLHNASCDGPVAILQALLIGGANILAVINRGELPVHRAVNGRNSEVAKCLLQQTYATTRRLPLHELLYDLTWIVEQNSVPSEVPPPLREALTRNVLSTDDVVEIIEYLVVQNHELISSRAQDDSLPLHVACRRGASFAIVQSLVNYLQSLRRECDFWRRLAPLPGMRDTRTVSGYYLSLDEVVS
jgi:hypothetical protein